MILVAAPSLWCSLSVHGAGLRIQVMRFSLLLVLTVALLSVAFRINSHHTSSSAGPTSQPTVQPTGQPSGQPQVQPSGQPTAAPSTPASPPAAHPHKGGGPAQQGSGQQGSGQQGSGGSGPQTLPVTGWDQTVKLGALALLLIGGGTLCMRVGATRAGAPGRQRPDTLHD